MFGEVKKIEGDLPPLTYAIHETEGVMVPIGHITEVVFATGAATCQYLQDASATAPSDDARMGLVLAGLAIVDHAKRAEGMIEAVKLEATLNEPDAQRD